MVYAADLKEITKINLTDVETLYDTTTFFNTANDNGRYLYKSPEATFNSDGKLWLYFGTGNTKCLRVSQILFKIDYMEKISIFLDQAITKNTAYCTNFMPNGSSRMV